MGGLLVIQPFSATAGFFDLPGYPAAYPESAIVSPSAVEVGGTVTLKIRVVAGDRDLNSNLDAYAITSTARKIYLGPIASRISGTNKDGIYQVVFKVLEYGSPSNTHTGDWKLGIIPADFTVTGYGYFFPFTVIDAVAPTPTPTLTPAPALCSKEGVIVNLSSQKYICVDVDGLLNFFPQIEGERLLFIKSEKIRILNKAEGLIYLLKSVPKENLRNDIRVTIQNSISEISQYVSKYRDSKIIQFDYISADNEVQILEKKVASIMTISASQKVTIS
jgi:hypothetical protein